MGDAGTYLKNIFPLLILDTVVERYASVAAHHNHPPGGALVPVSNGANGKDDGSMKTYLTRKIYNIAYIW